MKEMIQGWDRKFPGRVDNMFTALANVVPSHLMDRKLFPFTTIEATGKPVVGGDIAFDEDEGCGTPVAGAARRAFCANSRASSACKTAWCTWWKATPPRW